VLCWEQDSPQRPAWTAAVVACAADLGLTFPVDHIAVAPTAARADRWWWRWPARGRLTWTTCRRLTVHLVALCAPPTARFLDLYNVFQHFDHAVHLTPHPAAPWPDPWPGADTFTSAQIALVRDARGRPAWGWHHHLAAPAAATEAEPFYTVPRWSGGSTADQLALLPRGLVGRRQRLRLVWSAHHPAWISRRRPHVRSSARVVPSFACRVVVLGPGGSADVGAAGGALAGAGGGDAPA